MYLACTTKEYALRQMKLSQLAVIDGPYWERSLVQSTLHVMSYKGVDLCSSIANYSTIDTLEGTEVPLFINITMHCFPRMWR